MPGYIFKGGNLGNGFVFDGVSSYIEVLNTNHTLYNNLTAISASFWGITTNGGNKLFFLKYGPDTVQNGFSFFSNEYPAFINFSNNETLYMPGIMPISTDTNHYVFTWNNIDGIGKWYKNSILNSSSSPIGIGATIKNNTININFGLWYGAPQNWYAQKCFSISTYNKVLNQTEIDYLYKLEGAVPLTATANCIGDWGFNQKYGIILPDTSGNAQHGTVYNANTSLGVNNAWVDAYTLLPIER